MTREQQAEENRRKFPEIARIVDYYRAMGATVRLIWAENDKGDVVGRRPEEEQA